MKATMFGIKNTVDGIPSRVDGKKKIVNVNT